MKTWLKDHLIRSGHMTESGLTRRARLRPCPSCDQLIVVGLDNDVCAFESRVDPEPISELGEVFAVLEGRRTWALHREGSAFVLNWRSAREIKTRPAGSARREDVLREHRCNTAPVLAGAASTFAEAAPRPGPDASPEF